MASIRKRGDDWQVLWRDPDGTQRGRSCPTRRAADTLRREVEEAVALGRRWEPADARPRADLGELARAYLTDRARVLAPRTLERYAVLLELWLRWLGGRRQVDRLTRADLVAYHGHLTATPGRLGQRAPRTVAAYVEAVESLWEWSYEHDETGTIPRPRHLELRVESSGVTVAPSWAQMDATIAHLGQRSPSDWLVRAAVVMRCTGLRVSQALGIVWSDIEGAHLVMRPELGKSRAERRGRRVPLAPVLLEQLAAWPRPSPASWVVGGPAGRGSGRRERTLGIAWEAAGVPDQVWHRRPDHAFRKGFQSGLISLGAPWISVEYLVGHKLPGMLDPYTDPAIALGLEAAVRLVPPLSDEARARVARLVR